MLRERINMLRENRKQELQQVEKQLTQKDQQVIDKAMNKIAEDLKGNPIKIQVKDVVKPVIQSARWIPHLKQPPKVEQEVVEGLLVLTGKQ